MPRRTPSKTPFSVRHGNRVAPKKYRHAASVAKQERRNCAYDAECVCDLAVVAAPLGDRRIVHIDGDGAHGGDGIALCVRAEAGEGPRRPRLDGPRGDSHRRRSVAFGETGEVAIGKHLAMTKRDPAEGSSQAGGRSSSRTCATGLNTLK